MYRDNDTDNSLVEQEISGESLSTGSFIGYYFEYVFIKFKF